MPAGGLGQFTGIVGRVGKRATEQISDLRTVLVNRRNQDVRRRVVAQLDDQVRQVGLPRVDPAGLEGFVEPRLLRRPRLGLDHLGSAVPGDEVADGPVALLAVAGPVHDAARARHRRLELEQVVIEVAQGPFFDRTAGLAQLLPVGQLGDDGAGMIDRITHRVADDDALDFWADRLGTEAIAVDREPGRLRFADPEGMGHELAVNAVSDAPLIAAHREVPARCALQSFDSVHALVRDPARSAAGRIVFEATDERGTPGAGTVHHVAWSVLAAEIAEWRQHVAAGGARPTPVIDRFWFQSVYFREPGGVLYELATLDGAGFAVDEEPELMGRRLVLPPFLESERGRIEPALTPLPDPSVWRPEPAPARG